MSNQLLIEKLDNILNSEKEKLNALIQERHETDLKLDDLKYQTRNVQLNVESIQILLRNLRLNKLNGENETGVIDAITVNLNGGTIDKGVYV